MTGLLVHLGCLLALAQTVGDLSADEGDIAAGQAPLPRERFGVEPITPVLEVALPAAGDAGVAGDTSSVTHIFAPDGGAAFIEDSYETVLVWPLLMNYWRWWLGALAALSLLMALRAVRRVLQTPQRPGRPYCRACNYDLTGNVTGKCSECGTSLVERPAGAGRSTGWRLMRRLPWLALPAVYVTLWLLPADTDAVSPFRDDPVIISKIARWFEWRSDALYQRYQRERAAMEAEGGAAAADPGHWLQPWVAYMSRLRQIDLPTGRIVATVLDGDVGVAAFSPDNTRLFVTDCCGGDGFLWDIRERRMLRTIASPLPERNLPCATGFEWVCFVGNDIVRSHLTDLIEWDLRRGEAKHVRGEVVRIKMLDSTGELVERTQEQWTGQLVMGTTTTRGGETRVVIGEYWPFSNDDTVELPLLQLYDRAGSVMASWEVPHTVDRPLVSGHSYAPQRTFFYDDGRRMLLLWQPPGEGATCRVERWDMERRRFTDLVKLPFPVESDRVQVFDHLLFYSVGRFSTGAEHDHVLVVDLHADRIVAALEVPEWMVYVEHMLHDVATGRVVLIGERYDLTRGNKTLHALHYELPK